MIFFERCLDNAFVSGARGLRFKSRAGQIGHSVANSSPPLRHFFERSSLAWAQGRGDGPQTLVTRFRVLQRVKYLIWDAWKTFRRYEYSMLSKNMILIYYVLNWLFRRHSQSLISDYGHCSLHPHPARMPHLETKTASLFDLNCITFFSMFSLFIQIFKWL